jgi:hypothetical protein
MVVICVVMLASGSQRIRETNQLAARLSLPTTLLETCQQLVVDNTGRGFVPRIIWYCPDDVDLYVAKQKFLLKNPDAWVGELGPATLYVSPRGSRSTRTRRGRILEMLSGKYRIGEVPGGFWDVGRAYWILPGG